MLDTIISLDRTLFLMLNRLHTDWLDPIMLFISYNKIFMAGIILVILFHGFKVFRWKFLGIFFAALICFGLSDSISTRVLKNNTKRLRPCHEASLKASVHLAGKKCWGGKFGFVSSHASNTMALAFFFWLVFRRRAYLGLMLYAGLVGYSRIYLAKHYPLDVLCGFLLGMILAFGMYQGLKKIKPLSSHLAAQNNGI